MRRNGRRIVVGGLREEIEGKNMGRKGRRNGSGKYGKKGDKEWKWNIWEEEKEWKWKIWEERVE